jgi:large subunit ribosomal protein L30e
MTLVEDIQAALKTGNVILGYRESMKFIKLNTPKVIVMASNIPEHIKKEIEHNARVGKMKVEMFDKNSKELGIVCGKPFPVTVLVIKG